MTFAYLIKQPWFQILLAVLVVIGLGFGIYFYGKSRGRAQASTEFDARQAELLKKSQDSLQKADQYKAIADSAIMYADELKKVAAAASSKAQQNEARITKVYKQEQEELNQKYAADKEYIASDLTNCERCRDLCRRSNSLVAYGPEFASAACNINAACLDVCSVAP